MIVMKINTTGKKGITLNRFISFLLLVNENGFCQRDTFSGARLCFLKWGHQGAASYRPERMMAFRPA
jgi:hypothetical protein